MDTHVVDSESNCQYEGLLELAQRYGKDETVVVTCSDGVYGGVGVNLSEVAVKIESAYEMTTMTPIESPLYVVGDTVYSLGESVHVPREAEWVLLADETPYRITTPVDALPSSLRGRVYKTRWKHKVTYCVVLDEGMTIEELGTVTSVTDESVTVGGQRLSPERLLERIKDENVRPPSTTKQGNPRAYHYPHVGSTIPYHDKDS